MSETTLVQEFAVSAEQLYDAIADQDGMGAWMGAKISVPVRGPAGSDGKPGLVGTVRRVHAGPLAFDEKIVEAVAPRFLAYQICSPLPLLKHHRGEMRIESLGAGRSRLTWHIVLEMKLPLLGDLVLGPLGLSIKAALKRLARRLSN